MATVAEITQKLADENAGKPITTTQFTQAYNQASGLPANDAENQARLQEFMTARANLRKVQPGPAPVQAPIVTPPPQAPTVEPPKAEAPKEQPINPQDEYNKQLTALNAESSLQYDNSIGQLATLQANMDARTAALINNLKATYERRKEDMAKINTAVVANTNTAELRSGRARFASTISQGNIASEERAGIQRIADLDNELTGLILQAQDANDANKLKLLNQTTELIKQKRDEQRQAILDQITIARNAEQDAITRAQEARAQQKFLNEEQKALTEQLSPQILNNLGPDPEENIKVFQDFAEQYGIDTNVLMGSVLTYKSEQEKEDLLKTKNSLEIIKSQADILRESGMSGEVDVPGIGKIKIQATPIKGNFQLENVKGNLFVFNKDTGEVKKADITRADLNPENVRDFVTRVSSNVVPVNADGVPTAQVKSGFDAFFDKFSDIHIKKQEEIAGQSFSPEKRDQIKEQFRTKAETAYNNLPTDQKAKYEELKKPVSEADISMYSPQTQMIIKGLTTLEDVKGTFGTSVADKARYRQIANEVLDAQSKGLVQEKVTKETRDAERQLRSEYLKQPSVMAAGTISATFNKMNIAYNAALKAGKNKQSKSAADQTLITTFNKMLDETSVVREGEYDRTERGQAALTRFQGYKDKVLYGGTTLTDSERKDMVDIANQIKTYVDKKKKDDQEYYNQLAQDYNLEPDRITR